MSSPSTVSVGAAFERAPARANAAAVARLTALWALSESALGGVLHALKVPLMGLVMAGTAVVLITLIAHYASRPREILRALLLVLLVKAVGSPHSPITAYAAVTFQGLLGYAVYAIGRPGYLTSVPYAVVAMCESAVQRLLMLALFFGAPLWAAVDEWGQWVLARYFPASAGTDLSLAWGLVVGYLAVYFVGGVVVGLVAARLPERIARERAALDAEDLDAAEAAMSTAEAAGKPPVDRAARARWRRRRRWRAVGVAAVIAAVLALTVVAGRGGDAAPWLSAAIYVARTVAILAAYYFFVGPWLSRAVQRWLLARRGRHADELEAVFAVLPRLRALAGQQWGALGREYSGVALWRRWVVRVLALSLFVR